MSMMNLTDYLSGLLHRVVNYDFGYVIDSLPYLVVPVIIGVSTLALITLGAYVSKKA